MTSLSLPFSSSSAKLAPEDSSNTLSTTRNTFAKLRTKISDTIDETEPEEKPKNFIETLRLKCKDFIYHTWFGQLYEQLMLFISVLSSFEYIYKTYINTALNDNDGSQMEFIDKFDIFIALVCAFDWFLNYFIADHRAVFVTSFFSIIDIFTVLSILATRNHTCPQLRLSNTNLDNVFYVLCGLNTTRILRALKFQKRFELIEDEVQRFLAKMCLDIIIMILFNSALMQYLEDDAGLLFHTWTYYMLVTVATVGYGDISPHTDLGRFAAMGMISYAIITVPQMTNELIEKMSLQSVYARARFIPKTLNTKHILLCGDLTATSLPEFFAELFHEDHDIDNLHCVILQPNVPSRDMHAILKNPDYALSVTYLEGNPMNDHDLTRALASRARAVFIMTNKFSRSADEEDCKTILQQFAIQRHLRLDSMNAGKSKCFFCLQLIRPENERHLVSNHLSSMLDDDADLDLGGSRAAEKKDSQQPNDGNVVICLNEIKMGVIAKAVLFPGANTLLMNLLTSFADDDDDNGEGAKEVEGIETLEEDEGSGDWLGEYQRGCDWEIYTTELSDTFEGTTFCYLSEILYQKLGIILFGVEVEEIKKGNKHHKDRSQGKSHQGKKPNQIFLNPADFVIPAKSECRVIGFVIAKNKAQSDLTFTKSNQDHSLLGGSGAPEYSIFQANLSQLSSLSQAITNRVNNGFGWKEGDEGKDPNRSLHDLEHDKGSKERKQAWQELLKKNENRKSFEMIQEELQRDEERNLRRHYYLREVTAMHTTELADVYLHTSLSEEIPYVDNHIIVIAKALSNLYDLIRPLRARNLGVLKHIVILYPYDFPLQVWQRIRIFEAIWIVRGNALEEADIRRCGIFKAKQVVLLADASTAGGSKPGSGSSEHNASDALVDADIVFCYQAIKRMNENAHVVVEMIRHSNVGYLDPESGLNSSNIDYKFTSQFASGSLFTTSILDTLVCQAFYNTKVIDILNQMIGGQEHTASSAAEQTQQQQQQTLDAATTSTGNTGTSNTGAGNTGTSSSNTGNTSSNTGNTSNNTGNKRASLTKGLIGSALYQINLPEGLETRTYGALYRLLARRKQVPVGILRGVFPHTKSGPKGNKMPYVYTNPPKDTELFSCDKVFVLSQIPVKITRMTKDETRELQLYTTLRSKRKTAEDILNVVNTLRTEMKSFQQDQVDRESSAEQLQLEVTAKVHHLMTLIERQQQYQVYTPGGGYGGYPGWEGEVGAPGLGPGKDYLHSLPFEKVVTMSRSRSNTWTHVSNYVELGSPTVSTGKSMGGTTTGTGIGTGGTVSPGGGSVSSAPPVLTRASSAGRIRRRSGHNGTATGNGTGTTTGNSAGSVNGNTGMGRMVPPPPAGFSPPIMVTGMRKSLLKNGTVPVWENLLGTGNGSGKSSGARRSFRGSGSPQLGSMRKQFGGQSPPPSSGSGISPAHAKLKRVEE